MQPPVTGAGNSYPNPLPGLAFRLLPFAALPEPGIHF